MKKFKNFTIPHIFVKLEAECGKNTLRGVVTLMITNRHCYSDCIYR